MRRFVFLGSSCIYPKSAEQPIREEALLTGALEPTNRELAEAVATATGYQGAIACDSSKPWHP